MQPQDIEFESYDSGKDGRLFCTLERWDVKAPMICANVIMG
ncbi:hypothetical protein FOCG_08717 [Fusarium oxysporum f. sp. radicis-lycopersici 26381]|uniref:Uncharacterized protein n=1 Tax=Fusarium oxysporum Fo47 TaxID=660027 RepID=W9K3J8_FUSOX|nr:hypothetical protein FOZG_08127 [Fusarium oxysporum Fo47]EWZ84160.1 hypothetical protein FOWG_12978 [Fusarium oxysporum f. sp. lycopersici MN25]EXL50426.1 hypothetical protein FOCG_08717 [Fusarium oxysporum f. sp. radicis-lycopersici 26381]